MATQRVPIKLPTFHPGQIEAYKSLNGHRNAILRCGRRWGKTEFLGIIACLDVLAGFPVAYFAMDYMRVHEFYKWCESKLRPIIVQASQMARVIRISDGYYENTGLEGAGKIEFWTLNDPNAGRGRKYKTVLIDEAAFAGSDMLDIWRGSIQPTLLDLRGRCIVASNTNGIDIEQFFWKICNEPEHGFVEYWAPSHGNPYMPADELERLQKTVHPLFYQQEYLAKFIDWSGVAFFSIDLMFKDGKPIPAPPRCDSVFAVIDTAIKDGKENDGTAVTYWAFNSLGDNFPLILLDWDIIQIEGAFLETWLPGVYGRLEDLARAHRARHGATGAWIEDKGSGIILLQQARNRGWAAHSIENELTMLGKDARAINASGEFTQGKVKISQEAFDKTVVYKGVSRNHFLTQVTGFRIGDKDAYKRADDLLDTFTYAIALALGNPEGF